MAWVPSSRFFRAFVVFMFSGTTFLVGFFGVSLMVAVFNRGNALVFVLGLILLILSPTAFIAGVVYWTSSRPDTEDTNG
jgi:hypothetical protein